MSFSRSDPWKFGSTTLSRVVESEGSILSPFEIFPDCAPSDIAGNLGWLAPRFYDPASQLLTMAIQSFVIQREGKTILVDTCTGEHKNRVRGDFHQRSWPWLDRLKDLGITPEDVDVVLCTHLHVDHVGWNTRLDNGRWVPTFRNARYLFARKEWDYWRLESATSGLLRTGDYVADSVLPVFEAGQAVLIEEDFQIDDSVRLETIPGHTPGHLAVHLCDGGKEIILGGDLIHHPLQLRYPAWSTRFCSDPLAARATRERFLEAHADSGRMLLPAHFPAPSAIFIQRAGNHYGFRYFNESTPIDMQ